MAEQHTVIENIDALIREGLVVYDANHVRIGHVQDYSTAAAYLVVHAGLITHKDLYVPFSAIRSIDARDVFLTLDQDALIGDYGAPPPATIVVEGGTAATVVPSGYDGSPAEVNRVNLEMVRQNLARGMAVYATSGDQVGIVDGIDDNVGYMLVKQHHFSRKDLFIPFAAIDTIDPRYGYVFLAVSKDVLLKDYARLPDGTVLRMDAVAPGGDVIHATVVEHSEP
jgi:ribosomal 30S subunit maturation factor RimM